MFRNELERDVTSQAKVFRLVNNPHPAAAQFRQHPVVGKRLPDNLHSSCGADIPARRLCFRLCGLAETDLTREGVMLECHSGGVNRFQPEILVVKR